ncbi:MAG: oligosaccharide flippase family protein, partial [Bacteroidales bacterium]|nr:oligosaccharide flippase family protein [Bacteroidales bacterium]
MGVVIKQSIKGTIVTYIGVAIGAFTTLVILTRFFTTEEVGLTRVLIEAATLLSSLAQLGTSSSILRFYPFFKDSEKKDNGFFFWTVIIPLVGFMIFGLTYIILRIPITNYFSEKSQLFNNYFYFIVPLAFCLMYMTVFETNANVLMRIVVPKFVREILVRILSLTVYLLFAFKIISIDGMVVGLCMVYAVAMLIDLGYLLSLGKISLKPDLKFITKSLRHDYTMYTIMLVIASIATVITPFLNTFF